MDSNSPTEGKKESLPLCPKCSQEVNKNLTECPKCNAMLFWDSFGQKERLERISRYSLGQMFSKEQEYLFETIYRSERLVSKILYFLLFSVFFSIIYGAILGSHEGATKEIGIMALKVPLLLLSTLLISAPLLYAVNLFLGISLSFLQTLALLFIVVYQFSLALVSLSPILLLFVIYSDSVSFLHILNIAFFVLAGSLGIALLWKASDYLLIRSGSQTGSLFIKIWSVVYVFVGLQMAWSLKIFGDLSQLPLFKQLGIEGNFYMAIFELAKRFMGGGD
ncbi:MAG: hypothetical protein HUU50_09160 [Candidatus Brocadiae bacterium]|nr:hypothetical protein [Candidatus Brocadiia bacterium]